MMSQRVSAPSPTFTETEKLVFVIFRYKIIACQRTEGNRLIFLFWIHFLSLQSLMSIYQADLHLLSKLSSRLLMKFQMTLRQEYRGVLPIRSMTRHILEHQSFQVDGDPGKVEV